MDLVQAQDVAAAPAPPVERGEEQQQQQQQQGINDRNDFEVDFDYEYEESDEEDEDPDRLLVLTAPERALAMQLKIAAFQALDKKELPADCQSHWNDFIFAQNAIALIANHHLYVDGLDAVAGSASAAMVQAALDRMVALHYFREEYQVQDTVADATQTLQEYLDMYPGFLLYIADDPRPAQETTATATAPPRSGCVMVFDALQADFDKALAQPEHNWRTFVVGCYYCLQAMFPHCAAMRGGCLHILEMQGVPLHVQRSHIRGHGRVLEELCQHYPSHHKALQTYNCSMAANIIMSMVKQCMPEYLAKRLQNGLRLDEDTASRCERLSELFASNTPENLMASFNELVQERYHNEAEFVL